MNLRESERMNLHEFEGKVCVITFKGFGDESERIYDEISKNL